MDPNYRWLPINRREALREGFFGAAGVLLASRLAGATSTGNAAPAAFQAPAKAKSVIQIWMWGGPAHLDTFDPKPEAGENYCGPLNSPIETNVSGIRICELLPLLAKQADKYSLIRSMTHGIYAHETASYTVQTGRIAGGHDVYPSVGAVVSLFKGLQRRIQGADSALHRADRAAGPVLRRGLPGVAVQTVRDRRRSGAGALRGGRRGGAGANRSAAEGAARVPASTRYAGPRHAGRSATGGRRRGRADGLRVDPGRRRQSFRPFAGEGRFARPLRADHVRPIVPGGASAGRARRAVHHDQLSGRLGHPQAEFPGDAAQAAGDGQGAGDAARGSFRSAGCSIPRWSGGTANSAGNRRWIGKRPGTADATIGAACFRRWWRAAVSRAATWWDRPMREEKR